VGLFGKEEITCFGDPAGSLQGKNDLHLDSNTFDLSNMDQKMTAPSRLPLLTSKDIIIAASKDE
jgi:hypothetical protein